MTIFCYLYLRYFPHFKLCFFNTSDINAVDLHMMQVKHTVQHGDLRSSALV